MPNVVGRELAFHLCYLSTDLHSENNKLSSVRASMNCGSVFRPPQYALIWCRTNFFYRENEMIFTERIGEAARQLVAMAHSAEISSSIADMYDAISPTCRVQTLRYRTTKQLNGLFFTRLFSLYIFFSSSAR